MKIGLKQLYDLLTEEGLPISDIQIEYTPVYSRALTGEEQTLSDALVEEHDVADWIYEEDRALDFVKTSGLATITVSQAEDYIDGLANLDDVKTALKKMARLIIALRTKVFNKEL